MRTTDWHELFRVMHEEHGFDNDQIVKLLGAVGCHTEKRMLTLIKSGTRTMPYDLGDGLLRVLFMIDRDAYTRIYLDPHCERVPLNMSILFFPGINMTPEDEKKEDD